MATYQGALPGLPRPRTVADDAAEDPRVAADVAVEFELYDDARWRAPFCLVCHAIPYGDPAARRHAGGEAFVVCDRCWRNQYQRAPKAQVARDYQALGWAVRSDLCA